ncbi:MAG: helix-turn-helix transcriptional regulator [Deltaproteobacteria bacterium]|nr:helix-turn-helix transcriptional regulator [Deltaproteobacteria bacterium]
MTAKIAIGSSQQIGSIIRFHRRSAGLSRVLLAEMAGVGKTVVFDIEHGKQSIHFDTLWKVLDALNISIEFVSPLMDQYEAQHEKG